MSDVFVSYKAEDRRRVEQLVDALKAEGFSVWWDAQIGGGAAWRRTIEAELNAARCAIVMWSKISVGPRGTFVQDEAARAVERGIYLPVTIGKVRPPLGFGETQAFPLIGWRGDRSDANYRAVLEAARSIIAGKPLEKRGQLALRAGFGRRAVILGGAATAAAVGVGSWLLLRPKPAAASNSIAVLPFDNLSGDPRKAAFSDGIAEELRSALGRIAGVKVAGRISSEAVRGVDAQTAARRLRVANVLTGSVRESPSRVRISTELIDGHSGLDRWSENYDRPPGDSIVIQTDIAENVANSLAATLGTSVGSEIGVGGTHNVAAQRLLFEARAVAKEGTKEAREHAMALIDNAIRQDPKYADAYAQKSLMLGAYANNYALTATDLATARVEAMALARRAIAIAPRLPLGHAAVAQLLQSNLDMGGAASEFRLAVKLAPGDADIVGRFVYLLARIGEPEAALKAADDGIAADPLNHISYENRVSALYDLRRYQEAIAYAELISRQSPELFRAPGLYADCLLMAGRVEDAFRAYGKLDTDSWQQLNGQALALAREGKAAEARKMLAKLKRREGDSSSYQYAGIYAQLGDRDRALDALEKAWTFRDSGLASIKIDPILDPIRTEPRFNAVMKLMNFPS
jgi:serine/threonine-protein kinase